MSVELNKKNMVVEAAPFSLFQSSLVKLPYCLNWLIDRWQPLFPSLKEGLSGLPGKHWSNLAMCWTKAWANWSITADYAKGQGKSFLGYTKQHQNSTVRKAKKTEELGLLFSQCVDELLSLIKLFPLTLDKRSEMISQFGPKHKTIDQQWGSVKDINKHRT